MGVVLGQLFRYLKPLLIARLGAFQLSERGFQVGQFFDRDAPISTQLFAVGVVLGQLFGKRQALFIIFPGFFQLP